MGENAEKSTAGIAYDVIRSHRVLRYRSDDVPDPHDPWFDLWSCKGCLWKGDHAGAGDLHLALEIGKAIDGSGEGLP